MMGVLKQLRAALGEELRRQSVPAENKEREPCPRSNAGANYAEVIFMLVMDVMLPSGEYTEASALVENDTCLDSGPRVVLKKACESYTTLHKDSQERGDSSPSKDRQTNHPSMSRDIRPLSNQHTPDCDALSPDRQRVHHGVIHSFLAGISESTIEGRIRFVVGTGAAGLAIFAVCRKRDSVWRAARATAVFARKAAGDIGSFIVGHP